MITRRSGLASALAAVFAIALPFPAQAAGKAPERDRQAILAMAGDYRVRFDMRETAVFTPGYKPLPPKLSGGYESVRVIEDRGDFISLQHLLVVEHEGETSVVKHWRQDWTYEPSTLVGYETKDRWVVKPVPASERRGAWSQTVWQTDDSPRYGGVGRWTYEGGVASWESGRTLRLLARRDAIRHPVYTWYAGRNRHALTPTGWVHEQDNAKLGLKDGQTITYVHEVVLNSYERFAGYPVKAADDYWAKTRGYWAQVRAAWDQAIARDRGVTVTEEADRGSLTGPKLMGLADEVAEGKTTEAAAVAEARKLITSGDKGRPLAAAGAAPQR